MENSKPTGQTADTYDQPVAYDANGRPLYAHPPQPVSSVVHVTRSMHPASETLPPEIMRRHEESKRKYPRLNLSKGEYVISMITRHPIGLVYIWMTVLLLILAFGALSGLLLTGDGADGLLALTGGRDSLPGIVALEGLFFLLIAVGGLVASFVYTNNRFYLTNESVIQEIQTAPFARHEQTVNLANIEDASYRQEGILPHLLRYGTIRLSTEGDETTYRFSFVANPKRHIAILNNVVESFKNGRPIVDHTDD